MNAFEADPGWCLRFEDLRDVERNPLQFRRKSELEKNTTAVPFRFNRQNLYRIAMGQRYAPAAAGRDQPEKLQASHGRGRRNAGAKNNGLK